MEHAQCPLACLGFSFPALSTQESSCWASSPLGTGSLWTPSSAGIPGLLCPTPDIAGQGPMYCVKLLVLPLHQHVCSGWERSQAPKFPTLGCHTCSAQVGSRAVVLEHEGQGHAASDLMLEK